MKGEKIFFNENIPAFSVQGKSRSISVYQKKIWWQSSKTFQGIYVPSTHAYTHVLRLSLDLPYETR